MKRIIMPVTALAMLVCAGNAEATSAGLSFARKNLFNAQMRSYNAQINYYQGASLHYLKKMPALTAQKYGYSSYKLPKVNKKSYSTKLVVPTVSTMRQAVNATSVSGLMAALKGWGRY